jgi:hypothetical protein
MCDEDFDCGGYDRVFLQRVSWEIVKGDFVDAVEAVDFCVLGQAGGDEAGYVVAEDDDVVNYRLLVKGGRDSGVGVRSEAGLNRRLRNVAHAGAQDGACAVEVCG